MAANKLFDLVEISSGVPFRSRVDNEPNGCIAVIQARDISDLGEISLESASRVNKLPAAGEARLRKLDILLQPRGTRLSAGVLVDVSMPAVAAAPLLVLRCDPSKIDPEFLVVFLRMAGTQAILRNSAVGTYIPQIPRTAIGDLNLTLPDLESQRKLVELAKMIRLESDAAIRLLQKRNEFFELAVRDLATKDRGRKTAAGPSSASASVPPPAEP
jgi:hypothetical protein